MQKIGFATHIELVFVVTVEIHQHAPQNVNYAKEKAQLNCNTYA